MTWLVELIQIITALGVLANGIASMLALLQSRRNAAQIHEVHLATNSMKDALVHETAVSKFREGADSVKDGAKDGRDAAYRAGVRDGAKGKPDG